MAETQIDPIVVFMLSGFAILLALLVMRLGRPMKSLRSFVKKSCLRLKTIDVLCGSIKLAAKSWLSLVLASLFWVGSAYLVRFVFSQSFGDGGNFLQTSPSRDYFMALTLLLTGLFVIWVARILLQSSIDIESRSAKFEKGMLLPFVVLPIMVMLISGTIDVIMETLVRSIVRWDFAIWSGTPASVYWIEGLLFGVLLLLCPLSSWLVLTIAGGRATSNLKRRWGWANGALLISALIVFGLISALALEAYWGLRYFSLANWPNIADSIGWSIWSRTIADIFKVLSILMPLAIIVTVSERARASIIAS